MLDANPLLTLDLPIPFDKIQPKHLVPGVKALIDDAQIAVDAFAKAGGTPTRESVLDPLDVLTDRLDFATDVMGHLESVATSDALREAINASQPLVSAFHSAVARNEGVYRRLVEFAQTEAAASLDGPNKRFLEKQLSDFRRQGVELTAAQKERLSAIESELTTATLRHSQNVLDATGAFEWTTEDETELAGLPPSAINAAKQSAAEKGIQGARFTLQAPSYGPLMTYSDNAAIRKLFYDAFTTRASSGPFDNTALTARILELRQEKAQMLGFSNFADLVLADRMAKTGDTARAFIHNLHQRTRPHFERENQALQSFRATLEGPSARPIEPWDVAYYAEKQRRALYDFDEESLRPYFVLPRVLQGLFGIAHQLYGVTIESRDNVPTWHPDVKTYGIVDAHGVEIASFFLDVFPRDTKRGGAWMQPLYLGRSAPGGTPHVALLAANLTPPLGDKPALLTHRDVETLFHEFGHLMHHCLTHVEVRSLAGTRVAWDFVEMPSMIMENWCWEEEALALFAHHEETGAPLPTEIFDRMRRARTYRAANAMMRQLSFAEVDLALHTHAPWSSPAEMLEFSRSTLTAFSPAPLPKSHAMITSFSHLFGDPVGYAAGYYSYKWAEVLEADAFSRFAEKGIFNATTGAQFRDDILAKGNTRDPLDLYVDFMGHPPDLEPLFKRAGLSG